MLSPLPLPGALAFLGAGLGGGEVRSHWGRSRAPIREALPTVLLPPPLSNTMEYYSAIKMNEIKPFAATWVDLEIITLSEVSQTEKDKYHVISLICGV